MSTDGLSYASVAVVAMEPSTQLHVRVVSISVDDISFNGIWSYDPTNESRKILELLSNRLILVAPRNVLPKSIGLAMSDRLVTVSSFVKSARDLSLRALDEHHREQLKLNHEYSEYMSKSVQDRKALPRQYKRKLAPISQYNWNVDFEELLIDQLSKLNSIGVPQDLIQLFACSNAVKYLIDKWYQDERERHGRNYLSTQSQKLHLLPPAWEKAFHMIGAKNS